jgi:hypothetical protein
MGIRMCPVDRVVFKKHKFNAGFDVKNKTYTLYLKKHHRQ